MFKIMRVAIGVLTAWSQSHLLKASSHLFNPSTSTLCTILMASTNAMFIASPALLPNTLSMILLAFIWASWLRGRDNRVIFLSGLMVIIGWPYAAIGAGVPCLVSIKREWVMEDGTRIQVGSIGLGTRIQLLMRRLILGGLFTVVYILFPSLIIERYYYGRWTLPSLNALAYNVLSKSEVGGPEVFGVEPWNYYFFNLLLAFGPFFPAALISPLVMRMGRDMGLLWANMMMPMTVFMAQPHKEERFMFIVFPLICLFAAQTITCIASKGKLMRASCYMATFAGIALSISRSYALVKFYGAPQTLLQNWIPPHEGTVCMAASWYRFPSSFYLHDSVRLGFIRASITHLQPTYYQEGKGSTTKQAPGINGMNRAVDAQYTDRDQCTWFMGTSAEFPGMKAVKCANIIDVGKTKAPWRWVWIPALSPRVVNWEQFCLYYESN